jgi:Fic family protein
MDAAAFKPNAPGILVEIQSGEKAFVPKDLPPAWQLPSRLVPLLVEARRTMSLLEGIGRQVSEPDLLVRPLQQLEALRSSALEGTYATPEQLLLFELEPREVKSKEDPAKDWREVSNYIAALQHGLNSGLPLCQKLFKEVHWHLMRDVRGDEKRPGEWRQSQVFIGSNHRFVPPPLDRLSGCLDTLEKYIHADLGEMDPLIKCFLIHYQFECIHPFLDGNGRVGRLILSLMMKLWCDFTKPWLYMSAFFEKNKEEYIGRLFKVSTEADWDGWIQFCLNGTVIQAKDTIQRCENLRTLLNEYHNRLSSSGGDARLLKIITNLFKSPIVRIVDVAKILGVTYPTAKSDIGILVKIGILAEIPERKVKTYFCPEIFTIAYGN